MTKEELSEEMLKTVEKPENQLRDSFISEACAQLAIKYSEELLHSFCQTLIDRMTDYEKILHNSEKISETRYRNMANAIYGCKTLVRNVYLEGDNYKVEVNDL